MMSADRERLGDAIARAYGEAGECPPPETFLRENWSELDGGERERIEAHARGCAACEAERELARSFDTVDADAADTAFVVERLERRERGVESESTRVLPARIRLPLVAVAAAIAVLFVGAWILRGSGPTAPELPEPAGKSVLRGSVVTPEYPLGELTELPSELRWSAVGGADRYRVTLTGVDDEILWTEDVATTRVELPGTLTATMDRAVRYRWNVRALDAGGATVAVSTTVDFRVAPSGEAGPDR